MLHLVAQAISKMERKNALVNVHIKMKNQMGKKENIHAHLACKSCAAVLLIQLVLNHNRLESCIDMQGSN
jgi:hypothetical protein